METLYTIIVIAFTVIFTIYLWARKKSKYYELRGLPHEKPRLIFGNCLDMIVKGRLPSDILKDLCLTKFKNEPIFGFFDFVRPTLVVNDIELVHRVLIKDFQHFADRGFDNNEKENPYESSLFAMTGNKWRAFRHKFSPMFTSGKLKIMSEQMTVLSEKFVTTLEKNNLKEVDLKEFSTQLSMDVIGSCGYGIDSRNLGSEDSVYRKMGQKLFQMDFCRFAKMMLMMSFPEWTKKLALVFNPKEVTDYFRGIVEDAMQHRENNRFQRNDFVQLMLTLKEKGSIEVKTRDADDDYLGLDSLEHYSSEKFEISTPEIVGHAISFLTTGFEATALAVLFMCYDLSLNPVVQDRLRSEIKRVTREQGGRITCDAVKNMTYLAMCLNESQRLHVLAPDLFRSCTKDYTFPGTNLTIKRGEALKISIPSLHMNPDLYPNPAKFDPERFKEGVKRPPCAYMPFGDGPRMCIAMRFALLQVKITAAHLFYNFKVTLNPKTKPLKYNPFHFLLSPKETLYFDLEKC